MFRNRREGGPPRRDRGARQRSTGRRGFTLVELLAAVVIIAVLAALATPSFIAMMRDRRVTGAAQILADSYREARAESLRRGIAVLVRWRPGGGKGSVEIREAVVPLAGTAVIKGCTTADWSSGSIETRSVSLINLATPRYELAQIQLKDEAGQDASFSDVCFAPDGRTYKTYAEGGSPDLLTGVPYFEVKNTQTTTIRKVFVPPNGIARMQL